MNTTTTRLMAALIAITALAPAPALAADGTNPYTVKLDNGLCTFGIDLNNPEARAYSQDRGYINQSYVLDKIAKEVPNSPQCGLPILAWKINSLTRDTA